MSVKLPCIKCELKDNCNGLYTCNGCRGNFCSKHSVEHTDELRNRFEEVINEYNLVKDSFDGYKQNFSDIHWKLIDQLGKEFNEIKHQVDQCQKTENYSEQELDQWMRQLKNLKNQFTKFNASPSFFVKLDRILGSKIFRIYLTSILVILVTYSINSTWKVIPSFSNISFTGVNGPIALSYDQHIAEHSGPDYVSGSVRIDQIYSKGIHRVWFSFEQISSSETFIGITDSSSQESVSSRYGWHIGGKQVISQKPEEYQISRIFRSFRSFFSNQPRRDIQSGDILEIELNCIKSKVILKNQQTHQKYELDIDRKQSPVPWQIILYLDRHGDRVRLL